MAQNYKAGLIITGDASGGIRAIKATEGELSKLNQGFERGSRDSRRFGGEAERAGQQVREIGHGSTEASKGLTLVRQAATLAMAAFSIRQLAAYADGWSELNSRVLNVTKDVDVSEHTMGRLAETARSTYSALNQTAEAFLNNATTLTELGYSTERQLDLSDALNNSLVISATRGQQAESVLQALSRAFAAGELRGDNFNTVIQNGGRMAEALADGFGVTTIELRKMAAEGELTTSRVFEALTSQMEVLRKEAEEMPATIEDGWTLIGNASIELVGRLDKAFGASEGIAGVMIGAADAMSAATQPLIDNMDTIQDVAFLTAAVIGGRYASAFAIAVQRKAADVTASMAQVRANVASTTAARAKASETLRVAQADQAAASRALANGHAIAIATGNTTLRTKAITQMAAANQRAIAAEAAHTAAVNANSAAMARGTVAAQGMAAATRTGASALALIGGPTGAALIAGAGLYYFREELGLTDDKMQGTIGTIESLGDSFIAEFGGIGAELAGGFRGMRAEMLDLDAGFIDMKASAVESFSGIVESSASVINMGLIPLQNAVNALDSTFAGLIYRVANGLESAGAMPFGMQNVFGEQISRLRGMADGLMDGLIEPIGLSNELLEDNSQALRAQADALRDSANEIRGNAIPANNDLAVTYQTIDQWLSEIERVARSAGDSVSSNAPSEATIEAWEKYNDKLRDSLAAARDPSAVGAANRELDAMGVVDPIRRAITVGLALQEDATKRQKELHREAASAAQQAARAQSQAAQQAARAAEQAAKQQADALKAIQHEMDPLLTDYDTYVERVVVLEKVLAEGAITEEAFAKARSWAAEQYTRAATGAEEYEKQTKSLIDTYDSHNQRAQKLRTELEQINQRYRAGEIDGNQYARMVGGVRDEMQKLALDADPAAQEMARAWEEATNRIDETFADAFAGAFDSFDDFGDQLLDGFKRLLAEMAYQATLKPIVVNMTGQMQGAMGMGGGAQQGNMQGMFNSFNPGMLQSGWSTVSGWFGGGSAAASGGLYANAATGAAQGGLYGNAATGGLAQNGGWMSSAGGAMQSLGAGYAGMQVGNQLAPDAKYGNAAGTVGAAIGSIWGPIGAAIGGAIAAPISKGLFGGTWQTKDGGLNLGVSGGDITGNQYEYQRKSGGLFRGSSYRTQTSALGGEFEAALQQAYSAQEASLAVTLDVLGQQSSSLNAFSTGLTKISTKGKSEAEVEQAVQDWLQNIVNRAAQSVVDPAEYALAGESTVETLNRLATALTGVNPLLEQLHGAGYEASLAGGDAAASLVALSGGMQQFAQRAEFYYQNFYTETERQEAAMTQAAKAMGAFTARTGEIVTTTDQLRELVDGIDRNSEAGRELYAAAMQLAPALVEVENGLERVKNRFADMLNEAESALGSAEQQALSAWRAFENQSFNQQITLLERAGDSQAALALQRERELLSIDPLLHETQRVIWSIEDETQAKSGAAQAAQRYVNELARVRDQLSNTFGNIAQWVDQQNATAGTPGLNLTEAGDQFARQLVLAQSGDRSALQSITQYAEQYLTAGEAMYASGGAFQRIQEDVLDALQDLPDQISAEEFIAEEVKQALREQTQGISTQLGDVLRGDNPSNIAGELAGFFDTLAGGIDGVLTPEQLAIVMSGKATDAELAAIMRAVDLNGDGVMSGLESVIIAGMPTDAILGTLLRNKMNELDKNQLTHAQIRTALSPIASDAEISRLIKRLDVNGDGVISRQELTNSRLNGLAGGIGSTLAPMFDAIDLDASGLIDWDEFHGAFAGMASDEELRRIFNKLDADGSGQISRLEALKQSSDGTEGNTKSLEERARDQLQALGGLTSEMARTTDQFAGLNSNIVSLRDSINALGVAQEEVARIERERAAAEVVERAKLTTGRLEDTWGNRADAHSELAAIESRYAGKDVNKARGKADENLREGVSGWHYNNGQYRNWEGWESGFNDTTSMLWSAGLSDMTDKQYESWIQREKGNQGTGTWGAEYIETLAARIRAQELVSRYDSDAARRDNLYNQIPNYGGSIDAYEQQLSELRNEYKTLVGSAAPFANGGIFEQGRVSANSIVSSPTLFNMGLMGEADPEAIVPLSPGPGGRLGIDATGLMRLPDGPLELPMPNIPMPQFPALDNRDVVQVLKDLRSENKQLRSDINRLLGDVKTNTGNTANAVASSASQAAQQRDEQTSELRDMARNSRVKGRTV